jgi:Holliday junction resolvase
LSAYRKGARLEYAVMKFLLDHDYEVLRSAGSHFVDIAAFSKRNNDLDVEIPLMYLWVSCKYASARMSKKDKQDFITRAKACAVLPVEASRERHKRIVFTDLEHNRQLFKN